MRLPFLILRSGQCDIYTFVTVCSAGVVRITGRLAQCALVLKPLAVEYNVPSARNPDYRRSRLTRWFWARANLSRHIFFGLLHHKNQSAPARLVRLVRLAGRNTSSPLALDAQPAGWSSPLPWIREVSEGPRKRISPLKPLHRRIPRIIHSYFETPRYQSTISLPC